MEVIASIEGIDYVDDSKGTNVGATVAALDGLAQRAVLIAGGDGKGQDFEPLAAPVMRWCRAVMLIGRDAPQIRAALDAHRHRHDDHATLEEATRAATRAGAAGRRRAAVAGLRELRHVQGLRTSRRRYFAARWKRSQPNGGR